jgi:outer membrane protein OmpA-like peptidoglycan-associated protein
MVAQLSAIDEERRALVDDLVEQAARVDSDRSQLVKDTLDFVKKVRTPPPPPAAGAEFGEGERSSGSKLVTRHFTIFGTGPEINFGELAKDVVDASVEAGSKHVREVVQGIGDGVEVAKKTVDLTSALVDLYRKVWPEKAKETPPPFQPALPIGTLLDRQVNFEFNSAELDQETLDALRPLADKVRTDHTAILIEGHTDGVGTTTYNGRLSQRRAEAVRNFLAEHGVPASQMHTYGYGQGYFWLPYVPTDAANRRVRVIECTVAGENRCKSAQVGSN